MTNSGARLTCTLWVLTACTAANSTIEDSTRDEQAGPAAATPQVAAESPVLAALADAERADVTRGWFSRELRPGRIARPCKVTCGWETMSQGLTGAPVSRVLQDPSDPASVYVAGISTVYRSTDSAKTWSVEGRLSAAITSLAIDYERPRALYAATTNGLAYSRDAAKTWTTLGLDGLALTTVATSPSDPLRVYASSRGAGVFRSDDGGVHWRDPGSGLPYASVLELSVHPDDSADVVAALGVLNAQGGFDTGAVVATRDGGATWQTLLSAPQWVPAVKRCPLDPAQLYATVGSGVARSYDGGATWQTFAAGDGFADGITVSEDNCDDFYLTLYGVGVRHTTDGGATFGPPITAGVDVKPLGTYPGDFAVDAQDPRHLLFATQGGLYTSTNGGASWSVAAGILEFAVSGFAASPADPARIWLSSWGRGVWTLPSFSAAWERRGAEVLPSDYVQFVGVSPTAPATVFAGLQGSAFAAVGTASFAPQPSLAGNLQGLAFGEDGSTYACTQTQGLLMSTDGGASFTPRNGGLTPWPTSAGPALDVRRALVHSVTGDLFVGTNGAGLLRSSDGGATYESVLPAPASVTCLLEAGDALIACANGVLRSDDHGATWRSVVAGLPTLDVRSVVYDDERSTLYATTGYGVYRLAVTDAAWTAVDTDCLDNAGAAIVAGPAGARRLIVAGAGKVFSRKL